MNNQLRILFISRATLFSVKGGDTIQMINTAEELRKLGVEVDIKLCNDKNINYSNYDLIHFFNIIRPADILNHIQKDIPYVISPIFVEYKDVEEYNANNSFLKKLFYILNPVEMELTKVIGRWLINGEQLNSYKYIFWGHKKSIKYILKNASLILPNSQSEYNRLLRTYGIDKEYVIVNNAADADIFNITPEQLLKKDPKMVLCVARIEARKNQLNLIKALNNTDYELYLIGDPAPNHLKYYKECKEIAGANIHFIRQINQQGLVEYYRKSSIHILPSWFETTGLSSLEALFCGCKIIVTRFGDTCDYFDPIYCIFCEPGNINSIRNAVDKADQIQMNMEYVKQCSLKYSWKRTGVKTLEAYLKVLHIE